MTRESIKAVRTLGHAMVCLLVVTAGCEVAGPPAPRPMVFLGVPEDQEGEVGGASALASLPRVTAVDTVGYDEYLHRAKAGDIKHEETHGR